MNGPHTQVFLRDNRFTRLMDRIAEQNAMDGKPAGRSTEQFMNAAPLIPASKVARMSEAEKARTDYVPPPDDPNASMAASARAAALGLQNVGNIPTYDDDMPGDIGHVSSDPTDAEIDQMLARAKGQSLPGVDAGAQGAAGGGATLAPAPAGRPVALPRGAAPTQMGVARQMPNFANVEGFDLTRKVAVVDGMEFQLADIDVIAMKKFAIQVVLDNVTYQLAEALVALGIPVEMAQTTADKMRETVEVTSAETLQEVPSREEARGFLQGQGEEGRAGQQMQGMHPKAGQTEDSTRGVAERTVPSEATTLESQASQSGEQVALSRSAFRPSDDLSVLMGDGDVIPE